ncbi:MAG TPA: efflux RND transporter permease subunit [Candidatus Saccharimonadales bacterium]|nr:efflux RND transporter permease subunit [Candidatus Saccharimonadales bacterium]
MKKPLKKVYKDDGQDRLLPRFSLFIFDRSRTAAILWLCLTIFGLFSYTVFLKREGFPSVNIPYSVIGGSYIANNPQKVDADVVKPITDVVLKNDSVKSVQSHAQGTSYDVVVEYKEGTDVNKTSKELESDIKQAGRVPQRATMEFIAPKIGFTERGDDAIVSVYSKNASISQQQLVIEGKKLAQYLKDRKIEGIKDVSVIDTFIEGSDPVTGEAITSQQKFDRYGERKDGKNVFYDSVAVGITQTKGTDVIDLDDKIRAAVDEYNNKNFGTDVVAHVSASYAPDIKVQISELQRALLEGLLAVLLIGSLVIAIRASIITVISMLTVLAVTLGILFLVGYSLNTITLFSLILCLGLIVDDTIIMVEALDAQRRRRKDARETVHVATRKVSRAMVAATLTAALSFAPLLFVGGILGGFIRAIPVTVISSLLVSLTVALVFIPLFARYLLLGKNQMGAKNVHEPAASVEAKIAQFIGKPMLWARHSRKKLFGVGIIAIVIGTSFIVAAMIIFKEVTFNIFPASKDSNGLVVNLSFQPGSTTEQAEAIAGKADKIVAKELGSNFVQASYYASGSAQSGSLYVDIIPYDERDVTAPQLVERVEKGLKKLQGAQAKVTQEDVGPPASAFAVRIETTDRDKAMELAKDIKGFLEDKKLERVNGTKADVTNITISDPGTFTRADGKLFVEVKAGFNADDTTTLVTLAKDAVNKEFSASKIGSYGLDKNVLKYDFGQEDENQDSFKTLALAFPVLLFVIYLLLAIQFRSLAQPLLIFMAIPFSLFGITLGLYLTNNAFSFFAMLGFFALIGLSLKNTILLTDYANQLRRAGTPAVEAAVEALGERFRPLLATSLTAVVSLIPLAVTSPFWEGLTVVLICGLLSSTFLVIVVFPYYYLGAEFLRLHISRSACLIWLFLTAAAAFGLGMAGAAAFTPLVSVAIIVALTILSKIRKRRRAA